ncbi:MAG: hypothetical protein ACK4VI_02730 [Alphaproteobacteria bacterium]
MKLAIYATAALLALGLAAFLVFAVIDVPVQQSPVTISINAQG